MQRPKFLLIELPVFPKGVLSLGLPLLASILKQRTDVDLVDLNTVGWSNYKEEISELDYQFVGMKVSSQNWKYAKEISQFCKTQNKKIMVVWGGEFPTLMPDLCLEFADTIVKKRFEACAEDFLSDLVTGALEPIYEGGSDFDGSAFVPQFDFFDLQNFYSCTMGVPLETSVGCDRFCKFCMVHTMQPGRKFKESASVKRELQNVSGKFLNVVDYNIGMSKDHLLSVCDLFAKSDILGWMGEMVLDSLDDDEVLQALKKSRCKTIYCGLESISEEGLKSVNKHKTNTPTEYKRIIKKVQSYGVNIASGLIIGLDGTDLETFKKTLDFFTETGIEYVKITFLTYNPGTFYHKSMRKHGVFLTEDYSKYDGNHLTYLANGVDAENLYCGTEKFIREFYSWRNILRRTLNAKLTFVRRIEMILFNFYYRQTYFHWLQEEALKMESNGIQKLIEQPLQLGVGARLAEALINKVRKLSNLEIFKK